MYVDINSLTENNRQWQRVDIKEIAIFQHKVFHNVDCFQTVQKYLSQSREEDELYICPLYFDLDHENLEIAKKDTLEIVNYLIENLNIDPESISIAYSGKKGFHILVNEAVFDLHYGIHHNVFKLIAQYLKTRLNLESLDLVVYSKRRMLRMMNSIHSGTNRFKIPISLEEIKNMTCDEIIELSKHARKLIPQKIVFSQRASQFYKFYEEQSNYLEELRKASQENLEYNFEKNKPPVCVSDLLKNGWKKEGDRNLATVNLAIYFKMAGYTQDECSTELCEWVERFTTAKNKNSIKDRLISTKNVTNAVYHNPDYSFNCAMIRSLHGEKDEKGNYERVACAREYCEYVDRCKEEAQELEELHLTESNSKFRGKKIKTKIMIAGKKDIPYLVPNLIEYSCFKQCKNEICPLYHLEGHGAKKKIKVNQILEMCSIQNRQLMLFLRDISGIHKCNKYRIDILETVDIIEILAIPMVGKVEGKYTVRKLFALNLLDLVESRYYEIEGYVLPNPKTQEATILIESAIPLQDAAESFELTEEIKNRLKIFRASKDDEISIKEKLNSIMDDLTLNTTRILGRDEVLFGALLVYHSALKIKVPWDEEPIRGWLETVIIGDTGTGKSHLLEKFQSYVGLGSHANAESSSRTGLVYKMEQHGNNSWFIQWGAWPLADRGLIWVDECSAIDKTEYGHMTLARSIGKLEVKRAVTAETQCRVRAILSGNSIEGRQITTYTYGVDSLIDIFNNEDIRRFDFAMFLETADIDTSIYNQTVSVSKNKYSSEDLKDNILFAWSRTPDQIKISDDTFRTIFKYSNILSEEFGKITDVPLVSPADQRNKVTRLSVALAILLHNVDHNENIIVLPVHVKLIFNYLSSIYKAPACGLHFKNKSVLKQDTMTDDAFKKIKNFIVYNNPEFRNDNDFRYLVNVFSDKETITTNQMESSLNLTREDTKTLIKTLSAENLLKRSNRGFMKTSRFNFFIRKIFESEETNG